MAKPLLTANQVTLLRLALIPIPCWLLYGSERDQFIALVFATILGCTDFVDGYLARKYGSTVLGSLMDPIADKVFIAITFLSAVDLKWVVPWLVTLLFVREFLVTAARSVYEHRGHQLKSSYLARYKTWVQMCGIGMIMLMRTVSDFSVDVILAICAVTPLLAYAVRFVVARKPWKGAAAFAISFSGLLILHEVAGNDATSLVLMLFIVGITWASGLGYLSGVSALRGTGPLRMAELVRLVSSVLLPIAAVEAQRLSGAPKWMVITLVSAEMAHGGLDNLLAHHHVEQGALGWGLRLGTELGLLVAMLVLPGSAALAGGAAAGVSVAGLVWAFATRRSYYLGPKGDKLRSVVSSGPGEAPSEGG